MRCSRSLVSARHLSARVLPADWCVRACVRACVRVYVRACVRVRVNVRMRVLACLRARARALASAQSQRARVESVAAGQTQRPVLGRTSRAGVNGRPRTAPAAGYPSPKSPTPTGARVGGCVVAGGTVTRMGRAPFCFRQPGRGLGPGVGGPPSGPGRIEGMEALSIRPWPDWAVLPPMRVAYPPPGSLVLAAAVGGGDVGMGGSHLGAAWANGCPRQ